jgi:hypothetical protein
MGKYFLKKTFLELKVQNYAIYQATFKSERVIVVEQQSINISAISWREQVIF